MHDLERYVLVAEVAHEPRQSMSVRNVTVPVGSVMAWTGRATGTAAARGMRQVGSGVRRLEIEKRVGREAGLDLGMAP